jgi:hypothetical protein
MTRLSASALELLRTRPQKTTLYMSIFQPRVVFQAQINGSLARGARTIPFDNITSGAVAAVEVGMTLWVGSTAGAKDIGKIRIKSKAASQFEVSENSNIAWADNLYITAIRYFELWPIFPRIIHNPADDEDVIFYKDYDLAYTNQNSILGTFPCAGNHQALFAGEQVYYSATGSFNPLGDTLSYEWAFEGGTATGSASETPGFVTYPTPGHYVTRLMVSGSSGSNDTTYRYVSVYNRPGAGSSPPISRWEVSSLGGSRDEGGYTASFRIHDTVSVDENSVVVLFSEDFYGSTKQSLGGNSPNNEKIFFVGYVLQNSIRKNYQHSYTEFSVGSLTEVMKTALSFSVSVESKASPAYWFELLDMDCRRAIYHYLKWHTTALSISDFQFLGTDYKIQFFDADRTSMYDAIDNLMRNTLLGKVVSDRQGKVWMEVDARAYSNPTGSFTSVMEVTKRDWMNEPNIERAFSDRLSYYEAGGIHYSGVSTGTFSALLACAPGSAPSFRGSIEMPDGLAIGGQPHLNSLVGNIYANVNSRLPRVAMEMAINTTNLDIAPQETVQMTLLAGDTVANIPVNGLYLPNSIDWRYSSRNQILSPNIDFVNLVSGPAGETIGIPESVQDAGFDLGGWSVPQLQIPPLPILTIPPSLAAAISGTFNLNVNTSIQSYLNEYANVGWSSNVFFTRKSSAITVSGPTRGAGSASVILDDLPEGKYVIAAFVRQFATGGTAGGEANGTLGVEVIGGESANAAATSMVNSVGGSRLSAVAGMIASCNPSLLVQAAWSTGFIGGSTTYALPIDFSIVAFRISA